MPNSYSGATVTVRNLPPEPGIDTAVGRGIGPQPGCGTISVPVRLWDPGWRDQESLTFRITSTNPGWPGKRMRTDTWSDAVRPVAPEATATDIAATNHVRPSSPPRMR